jgi:hypothetical protein
MEMPAVLAKDWETISNTIKLSPQKMTEKFVQAT